MAGKLKMSHLWKWNSVCESCFQSTVPGLVEAEKSRKAEQNREASKTGKHKESAPCLGDQQAGNGPSRRHIRGSKIAKGLQSVKYSLLQYPKNPKVGPNWRAKKTDPFGFLNISVAKHQKNSKGTLWSHSKIFEKSLRMPKKNWKGTLLSHPVLYVAQWSNLTP